MINNRINNSKRDVIYKSDYREWKVNSIDEFGYFIIFEGFLENNLLNKISGNALKLYMYLGLKSGTYTGIVWHSNKTISEYFNKSERTIRGWMKELEDLNLIKRMRLKYDGIVYTYLLPYNNKHNNNSFIEGNLVIYNNNLYIEFENEILPITNTKKISIFFDGEWIDGKIESKRYPYLDSAIYNLNYFDDYDELSQEGELFTYVFLSTDHKRNIRLLDDDTFLIRIHE